jgi:hypothetical protein
LSGWGWGGGVPLICYVLYFHSPCAKCEK